jgi:hypothetical protein
MSTTDRPLRPMKPSGFKFGGLACRPPQAGSPGLHGRWLMVGAGLKTERHVIRNAGGSLQCAR